MIESTPRFVRQHHLLEPPSSLEGERATVGHGHEPTPTHGIAGTPCATGREVLGEALCRVVPEWSMVGIVHCLRLGEETFFAQWRRRFRRTLRCSDPEATTTSPPKRVGTLGVRSQVAGSDDHHGVMVTAPL